MKANALAPMVLLAASLLTVADASARDPRPEAAGSCAPAVKAYATATDFRENKGNRFKPISGTQVFFLQGGTSAGCVIVTFTAEAGVLPNTAQFDLQAVLDGGTIADPGYIWFAGQEGLQARAFTFVFPAVAPGYHNVRLDFRNGGARGKAQVGWRTTIVEHMQ